MGNRIIGVWESDYDEYGEYKPLVYANGSWHKAVFPYVYDESQWKPIGQAGTLMIPFMTSDGEYFYTSDGKMFLVRNHHNLNTYDIVSCTVTTMPTKTIYEVGETFNPAGMIIQVQYQNKGKTITRLVTDYTYSTSPLTLNDNNITIHCLLAKGQSENVTVPITIREPYNANANMRYESNNTFTLHVNSYAACWDGILQYSTDGYTWTTWDGTTTISAGLFENKYTIMLRGLNNTTLTGESISQGTFGEQDYTLMISPNSAATNVSLHGDLSALLNYQNKPTTIPTDFCFGGLFAAQEAITQASQLVLPFTTLTESCYEGMFYGCSNLINAPALPATTMVDYCYNSMFDGCESLTTPPALPATTLAPNCYEWMFEDCTSLTTAPTLPATTMADNCYTSMFDGCSSLTVAPILAATTLADSCYSGMFARSGLITAPALPATTLADNCYCGMFIQCTSLTSAPTLSATTMMPNCYKGMFHECISLTTPPALPATTLANYCYLDMFNGCISLTTAPTISATTLANYCCQTMFMGCTSLVNAPQLLATTMTSNCYRSMFRDCTALVIPPTLPATTLAQYCYAGMFEGCTSLTSTPQLSATVLQTRCYANMFKGCISLTGPCELLVTILANQCYGNMFDGCTSIKLSTTQTGIYQKPYRIPSSGTGTDAATSGLTDMFTNTGGTFTGTPTINTTYYIPYSTEEMEDLSVKFSSPNSFTLSINNAPAQHIWDGALYTSTDLGTWTEWDGTTTLTAVQSNNEYKLYINGLGNTRITNSGNNVNSYGFKFTGSNITVEGNIATLLDWPTVANNSLPTMNMRAFAKLFYSNANITDVSNLILPFTTLVSECYTYMFYNCSSLINSPELPATTLALDCYSSMFWGCASLTTPPVLPATTLAPICYANMFKNCTSLTTAPQLPALTMTQTCYSGMFQGCTSLTTPPVLPATTLALYCYKGMFYGCTSLTTAPDLPATTLVNQCYEQMFYGCQSLILPPQISATTLAESCCASMFLGCTSLSNAPTLSATVLATDCYKNMFNGCTTLVTPPELSAITLATRCYYNMFKNCTSIKLSTTQTDEYTLPYRVPSSGTGTDAATSGLTDMFTNTGGTFTGTPTINTTYYIPSPYYITFSSPSSFTLYVEDPGWDTMQYSTDLSTWNTWDGSTITAVLSNGKYKLYIRGKDNSELGCGAGYIGDSSFQLTGTNIEVEGNISGLIDYRYKDTATASIIDDTEGGFGGLFAGNTGLTRADKLILPYTNLNNIVGGIYEGLFSGCTSLITTPELPATTLSAACYDHMFAGCTSLIIPPVLPAMNLANSCYESMFEDCTSLTTAPILSATTAKRSCYDRMFWGCSSLINIQSNLPATTLDAYCYASMFQNCTSLTNAPALPATTLQASCYANMFDGCSSLVSLPELPATVLTNYCYSYMFAFCLNIKLSETQTDIYQNSYRIPTSGTGTTATSSISQMFYGTGGTFTGAPSINTTYYTSNTVIS